MGRCGFGIWEHAAREGEGEGEGKRVNGSCILQGTRNKGHDTVRFVVREWVGGRGRGSYTVQGT